MKQSAFHIHWLRPAASALLCLTGTMPFYAQEQKDKEEIRLNMDAVKMIQFDFNGTPEAEPKEAPLTKKWMEFKNITGMPRNMIDTTILWKPTTWSRFEPYTIWTKYWEDPIYDKLVSGRPKKLEVSWKLNPFAEYLDDGRNTPPSPGAMYERAAGGAGGPLGASAVIGGLDFIGFLYNNLSPRGRMLAHNRKHANAWKTYKDYKPTREDSLRVPNFYPRLIPQPAVPSDTDSIVRSLPADSLPPGTVPADTLPRHKDRQEKKPSRAESGEGNLYEYIRYKLAEDSIRRQKNPREKKRITNPYDVQKQIRRLHELND